MSTAIDRSGTQTRPWRSQRAIHRLPQFFRAIVARPSNEVDRRLRELLLNDGQWSLLRRLAAFDRAHHLRVYDLLIAAGHLDANLLRAALLHDIGKADDRGCVRTIHRVAVVLLRRLSPNLLARLVSDDLPGPLHGIYLAERHAELGAALSLQAGASARTSELIGMHERRDFEGDLDLAALIEADERAIM